MIKIKLNIQSISDIITNSSSELFAVIKSSDQLKPIYDILYDIFGWEDNDECYMTIDQYGVYDQLDDDIYDSSKDESDPRVELTIPYRLNKYRTYYKAGLEALLKEKFGDNFTIEFIEET